MLQMFEQILKLESDVVWMYGDSSSHAYPLAKLDTINQETGELNEDSALSLIVYGVSFSSFSFHHWPSTSNEANNQLFQNLHTSPRSLESPELLLLYRKHLKFLFVSLESKKIPNPVPTERTGVGPRSHPYAGDGRVDWRSSIAPQISALWRGW